MEILREAVAVAFVLALLGGVAWALRRAGGGFPGLFARRDPVRPRRLQNLERVALTPQHVLHLVRFGEQELIVSTHPRGCTVLAAHASAQSACIRAGAPLELPTGAGI